MSKNGNGTTDFDVDINVEYPLEDFMEDMEEIDAKAESNVIALPPRFAMSDKGTAATITYSFDPTGLFYISISFLFDKYGCSIGFSRWMKFVMVMRFLTKWREILLQNGLVSERPAGVRNDFMEHLLKVTINPRSGTIPKRVIFEYLKQSGKKARYAAMHKQKKPRSASSDNRGRGYP
jgi:hypothetical protein